MHDIYFFIRTILNDSKSIWKYIEIIASWNIIYSSNVNTTYLGDSSYTNDTSDQNPFFQQQKNSHTKNQKNNVNLKNYKQK